MPRRKEYYSGPSSCGVLKSGKSLIESMGDMDYLLDPDKSPIIVQGYCDALDNKLPQSKEIAYLHGWRNGRNDRAGKVESYQSRAFDKLKRAGKISVP